MLFGHNNGHNLIKHEIKMQLKHPVLNLIILNPSPSQAQFIFAWVYFFSIKYYWPPRTTGFFNYVFVSQFKTAGFNYSVTKWTNDSVSH